MNKEYIEQLKAECEYRKKQYDNQVAENTRLHIEYDKAFERLKAQQREIERLKTTLGQCNTELNSALESLKSQCREIGELKAEVKQAKIGVLNELKRQAEHCDQWNCEVVPTKYLDEMIAEVKNAEDKS